MTSTQLSDDAMALLLRVCRLYDAGIVIGGLVAIACGRLAGGVGIVVVGLVALLSTRAVGARHRAGSDIAGSPQEDRCTRR